MILLAAAIALLSLDTTALGQFMVSRPIVTGPLVGLMLGDPLLGLGVGALVELIWIGQLAVGNVLPLDATLLTGLTVFLADHLRGQAAFPIASEALITFALALTLPLAAFSSELEILVRRGHKAWVRRAQILIENKRFFLGDAVSVGILMELFLKAFLMALMGAWILKAATPWFLHAPERVLDAFRYAHWFLMALGCAAAVDLLVERKNLPLFAGTAVLSAAVLLFFHTDRLYLLLVAVLAGCALCLRELRGIRQDPADPSEENAPAPALPAGPLLHGFFRSFFLQVAWNFERGLNYGFAFTLAPLLKRLYPDEERSRSLVRHLDYFNTQPYLASFILGAVSRMEIERSGLPVVRQKQKEEEISALKMGMMGPAAAIGDNLFWATLRPFSGILAVTLMFVEPFRGGWLPWVVPLLFLAVYNAGHLSVRIAGYLQGLRQGEQVIFAMKRYGFQETVNGVRRASALLLGVLMVCMNHADVSKGPLLFTLKAAFFGGLLGLFSYFLHKKANVAFLFYSAVYIALILAYWPELSAIPPLAGGSR